MHRPLTGMTASGCGLAPKCTLGTNPLYVSFVFLKLVTPWSKFFLTLSYLGNYNKPRMKHEINLVLLKNLLRTSYISFMTYEACFSPNRVSELTLLLLSFIYIFLMNF